MATAILMKGGGGGTGSDEVTASADKVLSGYTYVGADTNDEAGTGTMANIGATDAAKSVGTGSNNVYFRMSRGAHLTNASSGYPEAYASYSAVASAVGLTGAKLLKGQTVLGIAGTATSDANATAAYIYNGKTAYVNGSKITGTMTVSSVVSFSAAAYSATQFTCTWKWPSKGPYSGVIIRGKLGGYPNNVSDGQLYYKGTGNNIALNGSSSQIISGAQQGASGTTYYFRIWVYCTTSLGELYSGYMQATAATKAKGQQSFTSSGTFTVPSGVTSIDIFCVGGGGGGTGGNASSQSNFHGGGGGAGGYTATYKGCQVSSGQRLNVTIGAGGSAGTTGTNGGTGGTSSVDSLSANGGSGSKYRYDNGRGSLRYGGSGGSGGAGNWVWDGASNGGNADISPSNSSYRATGQGTTTRAFGESSGTLYSGGGGGGGANYDNEWGRDNGTGGAGGGATTSSVRGANGTNAAANTGGGGSGGWAYYDGSKYYSGGSGGSGGSGIVIIRWGY